MASLTLSEPNSGTFACGLFEVGIVRIGSERDIIVKGAASWGCSANEAIWLARGSEFHQE